MVPTSTNYLRNADMALPGQVQEELMLLLEQEMDIRVQAKRLLEKNYMGR